MEELKKIAEHIKRFAIKFKWELIIIAAAVFIDQISKAIVYKNMSLGQTITLIPKLLHIYYTLNNGAAFSMLAGKTWFFILTGTVALIGFSAFLFHKRNEDKLFNISLSLIIGGTFGNYLDRIFNDGYVHDFIEFEYLGLTLFGGQTFAIFNFADSFLTVGVIMFAIYYIFIYKEPPKKGDNIVEGDLIEDEGGVNDKIDAQETPDIKVGKESDNVDIAEPIGGVEADNESI